MPIYVIDLFAGPGGLAEGFSSQVDSEGHRAFRIQLSMEKDVAAHRTLETRAFIRQFASSSIPTDYYDYIAGKLSRNELFDKYGEASAKAKDEAWLVEVGSSTTIDHKVDERIQRALGGRRNWLLIGGPPCQAYSLAGRSRIRGESEEKYINDHRHFLYREYLAIIARHEPTAFVMENVKGLLSTRVGGLLLVDKILADLRSPAAAVAGTGLFAANNSGPTYHLYSVKTGGNGGDIENASDFVVCAEDHGIPQTRHRVIIVGVRSDVRGKPGVLRAKPAVSIEDAIGDLPALRSGLSKEFDSAESWRSAISEIEGSSWLADANINPALRRELIAQASKVSDALGRGGAFMDAAAVPAVYKSWYEDRRLKGIANHHSRKHMRSDLHRYFFAAVFARTNGRSPRLAEFPRMLLPAHENIKEALVGKKFNDRFRVQLRGQPAATVVAHISKDGHYFIHYDPAQCRSLTVREAARLQTFPDNYVFEGGQTEQYRQVGNAVPPLLARSIARAVYPIFQ